SKKFLRDVGLPSIPDWPLLFGDDTSLPRLPQWADYRVLGFEADDIPICLDESHDGRVMCYEGRPSCEARFVNATVRTYGVFLTIYQRYCLAVEARISEPRKHWLTLPNENSGSLL